MLLFFDTETTDKWDYHAGPNAEHQPRIVQAAYLLTDNNGGELDKNSAYFTPDDWTIAPGAQAAHGITLDRCKSDGIHPTVLFDCMGQHFNPDVILIAHNIAFDKPVTRRELSFHYTQVALEIFDALKTRCTMLAATPVCKLPKKWPKPNDPYKWPKLEEAVEIILNRKPTAAHDALGDVTDCRDLYFELLRRGVIQ